jgi:glycosyltransferase involved in cell wall biosynthesis
MKVSVVIPCYNQGAFLPEAVESVLQQTCQDFEIIIVNDGSTDAKTNALLQQYSDTHPFEKPVQIIQSPNLGVSAARNLGIKAAQGDYILPLDADDKIASIYLEKAVKILDAQENIGIVYSEAQFFGRKNRKWRLPPYEFPKILFDNMIFITSFFRKADWEQVGGFNPNMIYGWEDYDFWLSLIALGREVYCIPEIQFFYRRHEKIKVWEMSEEQHLYSTLQLYKNHPTLFTDNMEAILAYILKLRQENRALKRPWSQLKKFFNRGGASSSQRKGSFSGVLG